MKAYKYRNTEVLQLGDDYVVSTGKFRWAINCVILLFNVWIRGKYCEFMHNRYDILTLEEMREQQEDLKLAKLVCSVFVKAR